MASNTLIGQFATGLWVYLGSPPTLSALTISGYAVQPGTIGSLNARLGTCYSGTGYLGTGQVFDVTPDYNYADLAILGEMFQVGWYSQLVYATMGAGGTSIPWSNIREADSSITRASPVNIGKEYREMAKDANLRLNYLVNAYLDGERGTARSIDYLNPAYPWGGNNVYGTSQQSLTGPTFFTGPS
jgi:hypothetical protein